MAGFGLIAPYAAWMAVMVLAPATDWAYALRSAVTAALLAYSWKVCRVEGPEARLVLGKLAWGAVAGIVVLVIWIAPDSFGWYRKWCVLGDPYSEAVALNLASPLTWVRLLGSAFVISVAEELFFRKWLIPFAGFWWMVALFAVEHDRYVVGAVAGIVYGLVYLRRGLLAAIVAHSVTNLGLGLYVIQSGRWEFW